MSNRKKVGVLTIPRLFVDMQSRQVRPSIILQQKCEGYQKPEELSIGLLYKKMNYLSSLVRLNTSEEHLITKAALKFTIHTAARSGEVRFATWKEVDLEVKEWCIPAERMKMRTPHIVPLPR